MTGARLFDDNMYRYDEPQPSYWEATAGDLQAAGKPLSGDASCEVAIIGGGYTGLSAAYHLAKDHQIEARVVDAGHFGWGASGRNGGFCCMGGSFLELHQKLKQFGVEETRKYYNAQKDAVELVRGMIASESIDTPMQGDGELELSHSRGAFSSAQASAAEWSSKIGVDMSVYSADEIRERFCDCVTQFGGVLQKPTFGLHPLRFAKGLALATEARGVTLHPHSEVVEWSKADGWHSLSTRSGTLKARTVILAANGFLTEDLHPTFAERILPIISAIVVTRPLSDGELAAHHWTTETPVYNTRPLMNYFRLLPDRRFMFGGRGHSTGNSAGAEKNFATLIRAMREQWPGWKDVDIEYQWHGFICATSRLTPCIGRLDDDPSVLFGFGYHGNGVNNSNWSGKQLADWLGSGSEAMPEHIPVPMRGLSDRFPLASMRLRILQASLAWKRFRNWVG